VRTSKPAFLFFFFSTSWELGETPPVAWACREMR
jgi:hypothetical protein